MSQSTSSHKRSEHVHGTVVSLVILFLQWNWHKPEATAVPKGRPSAPTEVFPSFPDGGSLDHVLRLEGWCRYQKLQSVADCAVRHWYKDQSEDLDFSKTMKRSASVNANSSKTVKCDALVFSRDAVLSRPLHNQHFQYVWFLYYIIAILSINIAIKWII